MAAISITPASVLASSSAAISVGTLGTTVTQGQSLSQAANGTIVLYDADAVSPANVFVGFSLTAGASGQPVFYVTRDSAYIFGGGASQGATIWGSPTAGGITETQTDIEGSLVTIIGAATTGGAVLNLNPTSGEVYSP